MTRARATLLASLALMLLVGALVLARTPLRVVRVGGSSVESLGTTTGSAAVCQQGEALPANVSAIRLGLEASFGPKVLLQAYSGSRAIATGSRGAGWTGSTVTVPVDPLKHAAAPVKICFQVPANSGHLQLYGAPASTSKAAVEGDGQALSGRVSVEYLAPGGGSWWSRAQSVARHMGLGRALEGTWVALLAALLALAASAVAIGLAWRTLP
jgi:hypothetical protein